MYTHVLVCGRRVKRGFWTCRCQLSFTTEVLSRFGGETVPADTRVRFFETSNSGFLLWTEPDGRRRIASQPR